MTNEPMAFPFSYPSKGNSIEHNQGMTLRDWFAGQAMLVIPHMGNGSELQPFEIAHDAYNMADAMLEARK